MKRIETIAIVGIAAALLAAGATGCGFGKSGAGGNPATPSKTQAQPNPQAGSKPQAQSSGGGKWEAVADAVIRKGQSYIGVPYVFGTRRFQDKTFDCSSFVQYLYADQGIALGWNSREQAKQGQWIPFADMRKGDIMFFSDEDYPNETGLNKVRHVGIYMGDKKILHTYEENVGVIVSDVLHDIKEGDYWYQHFLFAKRVIPDNPATLSGHALGPATIVPSRPTATRPF